MLTRWRAVIEHVTQMCTTANVDDFNPRHKRYACILHLQGLRVALLFLDTVASVNLQNQQSPEPHGLDLKIESVCLQMRCPLPPIYVLDQLGHKS